MWRTGAGTETGTSADCGCGGYRPESREIRIIDPDDIADMFIMSTHNLPLNFLIDQLKEDIPGDFPGIQPDLVGFYMPVNEKVTRAVQQVYDALPGWEGLGGFTLFEGEEEDE